MVGICISLTKWPRLVCTPLRLGKTLLAANALAWKTLPFHTTLAATFPLYGFAATRIILRNTHKCTHTHTHTLSCKCRNFSKKY